MFIVYDDISIPVTATHDIVPQMLPLVSCNPLTESGKVLEAAIRLLGAFEDERRYRVDVHAVLEMVRQVSSRGTGIYEYRARRG